MNTFTHQIARPALVLAVLYFVFLASAMAGPGAHGPNGEHLDMPSQATAGGKSSPRLDAKSDLFELVARLDGGELSILIDRFDTNEPVLDAAVEVESGQLKAKARFHGDLGDYAVDDPAMLQLLSAPGEHPLVITVIAGKDSDLLDGVLRVMHSSPGDGHAHGFAWGNGVRWAAGALIALIALALMLTWRQRRSGGVGAVARQPGGPA